MELLPIGTQLKRRFDGAKYTKVTCSDDIKKPCKWTSKYNSIYVSDTTVYANKQYELLGDNNE